MLTKTTVKTENIKLKYHLKYLKNYSISVILKKTMAHNFMNTS